MKNLTATQGATVTLYAQWKVNSYNLTINPNGGTWNNTTSNSTVPGNYGTTKKIANPTAPAGYKVTFNGNGGSTPAEQTSTKSFSGWTKSGSGSYVASVAKPSVSGMTITEGTENGEKYYRYNYTANKPTADTWYSSRFAGYTYTSGDTYQIKLKVRVNSVSNGGNITFRHSALANDYGTPGLQTKTFSAVTSGWTDVVLTRTISGTTTTLSGKTVNIAPVFEMYTNNLKGTSASINFDIKDLEIINTSKMTILQSMDNKYMYGAGAGTLTANYSNNSITLPTPTRTGYTFKGWYTAASGGENKGGAGAAYTPTANTTLYAQWTINQYNIDLNFNVDGTAYYSGYNGRIYVRLKVAGVDKGYVQDFGGSYNYGTKWEIYGLKLDGTTISYTASGTLGAENLSLMRYFYTLTLGVNNGDYGSVSPTSLIVPNNNTTYSTSGATLTLKDGRKVTATAKSATGYTTTFTSWSSTSGTITGATTVNANFTRTINNYYIDLNLNVDGKSYGTGYNNRILVGLRVAGVNKGYVQDYYT